MEIQGHTERDTSKWTLTLMFSLALSIDVQNSPPEPLYYMQMVVLLLHTFNFNLYKRQTLVHFFTEHSWENWDKN